MVRVDPDQMRASAERCDSIVEVVDSNAVVPRIAAGWFERQSRGADHPGRQEREVLKAHEWRFLRQFVQRDATGCEHGDCVGAIDVDMATGVGGDCNRVEETSTHNDGRVSRWLVPDPNAAQLHRRAPDGPTRSLLVARRCRDSTPYESAAEQRSGKGHNVAAHHPDWAADAPPLCLLHACTARLMTARGPYEFVQHVG